jgi:hypothetical protein
MPAGAKPPKPAADDAEARAGPFPGDGRGDIGADLPGADRLDELEQLEPDLRAETLTGDLRDAFLRELRSMTSGWLFLPEHDQRDRITRCERLAEELVRQTLTLTQSYAFPAVPVTVGKMTVDKSLEVKCVALIEEANIIACSRQAHRRAVLLMVDPEEFHGEREPAKWDADQPSLSI